MRIVLLVIVILLLAGALPAWPYSTGWGYYPSGGLGLLLIVLLIFVFTGRLGSEAQRAQRARPAGLGSSPQAYSPRDFVSRAPMPMPTTAAMPAVRHGD